tara:strand:- start:3121 stop:3429 length:309 start_codon:yes stop_codon:yes gene_type:complete
MPEVARVNDTINNNHACEPTSSLSGTTKTSKIEVNGKKVALDGDVTTAHTVGVPPVCVPHTVPITASYSSKVEWEGQKCLAVGDSGAGHIIASGSSNVQVGS